MFILSNNFPLGVDDDIILMVLKLESVLLIYYSNITGKVFFVLIIHGMINGDSDAVHTWFV